MAHDVSQLFHTHPQILSLWGKEGGKKKKTLLLSIFIQFKSMVTEDQQGAATHFKESFSGRELCF